MRTLGWIAVAQALLVGAYLWVERGRDSAGEFVVERLTGPAAPPSGLVRVDGTPAALAGPTLVHFWATSCGPCRVELPALLAYARAEPELTLRAVAVGDDAASLAAFFAGSSHGPTELAAIPPEVVLDPSGVFVSAFGVGALPDTYLVDAQGRARARFAGPRPWGSAAARAGMRELLGPR